MAVKGGATWVGELITIWGGILVFLAIYYSTVLETEL